MQSLVDALMLQSGCRDSAGARRQLLLLLAEKPVNGNLAIFGSACEQAIECRLVGGSGGGSRGGRRAEDEIVRRHGDALHCFGVLAQ